MKITREFSFETAHMLSTYDGPCHNLHGHSYKLQVTLEGEPKNSHAESDSQMIMDFTDLKSMVNEYIVSVLDHAVIFSGASYRGSAEEELLQWAQRYKMSHIVLESRCTAECIALWIKKRLQHEIGGNITVKLWETANSFVEV